MREHEKRYRSRGSDEDNNQSTTPGQRKTASRSVPRSFKGRERAASARQKHDSRADHKMTYDDYLAHLKDTDKIIEVDEDTAWVTFKERLGDYSEWLKGKWRLYAPVVWQKLRYYSKLLWKKRPIHRKQLRGALKKIDGWTSPVKAKYGAQNIYFGALTIVGVLVVLVGAFIVFGGSDDAQEVSQTGSVQGVDAPAQPDFDVALPEAQSATEKDIRFDPSVGVASYRDEIRGREITISQQPLTDEQKADRDGQLEIIAVNLLAEITLETDLGPAYLSNTSPDGTSSQVLVFMTDDLLIFIRTSGVSISPDLWVEYVNRIRP